MKTLELSADSQCVSFLVLLDNYSLKKSNSNF